MKHPSHRPPRQLVGLGLLLAVLGGALVPGAARAEVYGGIEIGARGVKATVLDVTGGAGGYDAKVLLAATENTSLVANLGASGRFDPAALKTTVAAVARFADDIRKEHHVPAERLYVVGSSGLFSPLAGKADAIKANQDALAAALRDACDLRITFIDVEREVELSIEGTVPPRELGTALLLDVGGGNTKGGYRDGAGRCVSFGIPYASVTFTDLVRKWAEGRDFAAAAEALRAEVVEPALRKAVEGKPGLRERQHIYLSGGAVWAMATLVRPGDRSEYVTLTGEDVEAYRKLLRATPGAFPSPDLSAVTDPAVREAARKEVEQVRAVFKPEQLVAGAEILKALADEFGFARGRKASFVRHAQVAWIVAYVAEKAGQAK